MALVIRACPSEMRSIGQRIEGIVNSDASTEQNAKILVTQLREAWDGAASEDFSQLLEKLYNGHNQLKDASGKMVESLHHMAEIFENIDQWMDKSKPVFFAQEVNPAIFILAKIPCPRDFFLSQLKLSSGEIRVVPDEVRVVGAKCMEMASAMDEIVSGMTVALEDLQNVWEGNSFNRFKERMEECLTSYRDLSESYREVGDELNFVAARYEEIDNMMNI